MSPMERAGGNAVGTLAASVGLVLRFLLLGVQRLVEVTPLVLVIYGIQLIYVPAAWIAAGLILAFLLYGGKR